MSWCFNKCPAAFWHRAHSSSLYFCCCHPGTLRSGFVAQRLRLFWPLKWHNLNVSGNSEYCCVWFEFHPHYDEGPRQKTGGTFTCSVLVSLCDRILRKNVTSGLSSPNMTGNLNECGPGPRFAVILASDVCWMLDCCPTQAVVKDPFSVCAVFEVVFMDLSAFRKVRGTAASGADWGGNLLSLYISALCSKNRSHFHVLSIY